MARFSKEKWPPNGPIRALLEYLDELHRNVGQPSAREIGKAIGLAPSTVSPFFNGSRLINKGNLELLVEYLDGDTAKAERLRQKASTAWNSEPANRHASTAASTDGLGATDGLRARPDVPTLWPGDIKISGKNPRIAVGHGQTVHMNTTIKQRPKKQRAKKDDRLDQTDSAEVNQPLHPTTDMSQPPTNSPRHTGAVVRPLRPRPS